MSASKKVVRGRAERIVSAHRAMAMALSARGRQTQVFRDRRLPRGGAKKTDYQDDA